MRLLKLNAELESMARPKNNRNPMGSVRIVGGRWRGRRLPVLQREGLRPTGDRQRETLFNWLQGVLPESKCLDLFAGSGALGLEALSRGAQSLQAVELDREAALQLQDNIRLLEAQAKVFQGDWQDFLRADGSSYDVVFLDPPFAKQLLNKVIPLVDRNLSKAAWVYLEDDSSHQPPQWPERWQLKKEKISGGTVVRLFQVISRDTC
ncbi:MAG: 16S rRNA (guanine(966)-N(2))-methyltransferase RsmD [Granulosicoccaceae bacterium]